MINLQNENKTNFSYILLVANPTMHEIVKFKITYIYSNRDKTNV